MVILAYGSLTFYLAKIVGAQLVAIHTRGWHGSLPEEVAVTTSVCNECGGGEESPGCGTPSCTCDGFSGGCVEWTPCECQPSGEYDPEEFGVTP